MTDSFPCIICGRKLQRVVEFAEAQPADGIMCETPGNYGSTVYDSMDGEYLAFSICDPCMITAGEQGRVMTYRKRRPILVSAGPLNRMVVGYERLRDRPYIPWHAGLTADDEPLFMDLDELAALPQNCELIVPLEEVRVMAESEGWCSGPTGDPPGLAENPPGPRRRRRDDGGKWKPR